MKKITTRLSLLLLMAVLCIVNLARAQDVTPTSTLAARRFEAGEPLRWFVETPLSLPASGGFSGSSIIRAQSGPWTMHLVGQLAKHPELNRRQLQIILDAIAISTASADTHTLKVKADNNLQNLRRLALAAFTKKEVASLFDNVDDEKTEQEILRKYYDLSTLPLKGRRASFRRASPEDKSGLWRTHLALVFVRYPQLNEWQKEIILSTILLLTPEHYDVPSNSPEWKTKVREPSRVLEQQIDLAFSSEDAAKIFTTLGYNTEGAKRGPTLADSVVLKSINHYAPVSDSGPYQQWIHSRFSTQDLELEQSATCGCNMTWDFCEGWKYCNASTCSSTQDGCGLGWSYPCNGVCR